MSDYLSLLRREFAAEEGSFLLTLRGARLEWDKAAAAFSRLEKAMRWACVRFQDHDQLDRWMADGCYEAARFVRAWTSHPNFRGQSRSSTTRTASSALTTWPTGSFTVTTATTNHITGPTCNRALITRCYRAGRSAWPGCGREVEVLLAQRS